MSNESFPINSNPLPEEVSPEEAAAADEIFRRASLEFEIEEKKKEIEETFSFWFGTKGSEVRDKLVKKGFEVEDVDDFLEQAKEDFVQEIRSLSERFAGVKERLSLLQVKIDQDPSLLPAANWIRDNGVLDLVQILVRKIKGELDVEDKLVLDLIAYLDNEGVRGSHVALLGGVYHEINLSLLNGMSLDDYGHTLDHEIGHYVLSRLAQRANDLVSRSVSEPENIGLNRFSGFLRAANETYAHILGKREPDFNSYRDKINPELFKLVYSHLVVRVKNLGEEEKEDFFVRLLNNIANEWREDLSKDEFYALVTNILVHNKFLS